MHSLVQVASKAALLHRSRVDIIANILLAANGGAKKTHIMYKCNLSFKQLHAYLKFLVEIGLLSLVNEKTKTDESFVLFETTKKGQSFLKTYKNLKALLSPNSS